VSTPLQQAKEHLAKAREFLEAAKISRDFEMFAPAVSAAVTSGINSKDAICLRLTGRTGKTENHQMAIAELKAAGPAGAQLATTFDRLLKVKPKAQYQTKKMTLDEAEKAVQWAQRMYDGAEAVVNS
jgi:uncharacterized protein (UPF0332 family)